MTSFEDFLKESKNLPEIKAQTTAGIQQITGGIVSGFNDTQAEKDKFSKEVANYVTSNEVISSLSDSIGKPKDETEEEFVERASRVLRAILKQKFNV